MRIEIIEGLEMRISLKIKFPSLKEIKDNLVKIKIKILLIFNIPIIKIIIKIIILIIKAIKKVMIVRMNFKTEKMKYTF